MSAMTLSMLKEEIRLTLTTVDDKWTDEGILIVAHFDQQ